MCPGCVGSCSCQSGDLKFDNLQLSTISCSLDHQPRVVRLDKCSIKKEDDSDLECGKLADNDWEGDTETVATGGLFNINL